jgi:phosphoribosylglycinamide formyltransferase-1
MKQARIVLLASGSGSIAQSIIDAVANGTLDAQIVGLISDQPKAQV